MANNHKADAKTHDLNSHGANQEFDALTIKQNGTESNLKKFYLTNSYTNCLVQRCYNKESVTHLR